MLKNLLCHIEIMENQYEERLDRIREVRPFALMYIATYIIQIADNVLNNNSPVVLWFSAFVFGVPLAMLTVWFLFAIKHPYSVPAVTGMALLLVGSVVFLSNAFNVVMPSPYSIFASGASFFMDTVGAVVFVA